ncbi:MAG: sulfite exporter TauE/SafE family protein [Dehalococcoidia bacterium]
MTGPIIAGAVGIAFLAAGTQSLTGFGFALVMAPLLSLIWDVKLAVATSVFLGIVVNVPLTLEVRRRIRLRKVVPLLLGSILGIPAGVVILDRTDPEALKILVATVVIAASLLLYFAPRVKLGGHGLAPPLLVGVLSGTLGSSTSMGGPPAVLYLLGHEREIEDFRSTLLAFFLPSGLLTLAGLAIAGRVTPEVLGASGAALPALGAGLLAGLWLRLRVQAEVFRALVVAVLLFASVAVILSAVAV